MPRICVFCGSSHGARDAYGDAARRTGAAIARRGLGLVYGGGSVGLMGELANAALAARGEVIGVIPEALLEREKAHPEVTELHVVGTMHERKALMAQLADAFLALPGGYGTLEELFEVLTWAQLGLHRKPFGLLEVDGYYGPLLTMLDHAVAEGFVLPHQRDLVIHAQDPEEVIEALLTHRPPSTEQVIGPAET